MKVLCLFLLSTAVVFTAFGQDLRDTAAAKAACGPPETQFKTDFVQPRSDMPSSGKAIIYVIQISDPVNYTCLGRCGSLTKVGLDTAWVGATQGNSFLRTFIDPGMHHLCANWESHAKVLSHLVALQRFWAEPSKTYYFAIRTSSSSEVGAVAGFTMSAIDEDEGQMLIEAYPESKSTKK